MWEQYKKTFVGMQALMLLAAWAILSWSHRWSVVVAFFVTMQIGSVLGAMWATRLKRKFRGDAGMSRGPA